MCSVCLVLAVRSRESMTCSTRRRPFGRRLRLLRASPTSAAPRATAGTDQLEPERGVVAVDLLHVELAHELDGVGLDHLSGHHDREARRVGDHEVAPRPAAVRSASRSSIFGLISLQVLAAVVVVGHVERRCACRLRASCPVGSSRKPSWKWLKFGRSGTSSIRTSPAPRTPRAPRRRRSRDAALDLLARSRRSTLIRLRDVAARVVDVGLQQHAVARGLVELDLVLGGEQVLELRAVEAGGAADQRQRVGSRKNSSSRNGLQRRRPGCCLRRV